MPAKTDRTRFDLKYATSPATAMPRVVGISISVDAVNIPLIISIVRDV